MSRAPRLIVFAGSIRAGSFNARLAAIAADLAAVEGAEITRLTLADYPMPLYHGDIEASDGIPAQGRALKEMFKAADGFIIAAPEYNGSITPLLKNTLDWVSRQGEDPMRLMAYQGKVAGLLAASPGGLGGLRGLFHVRQILNTVGVHVIPDQHVIRAVNTAFDSDGALANEADRVAVQGVVRRVVAVSRALSA